jgi:hypothetical protein
MAYTRPTNLKTPLQSVMEWVGERSLADIIHSDPRFQKTTYQGSSGPDRPTNKVIATVFFTWKPDNIPEVEEGPKHETTPMMTKRTKKNKQDKARQRRPSPGSPEKRKRPGGVRTRRQAQLEDEGDSEEGAKIKQEVDEAPIKKEPVDSSIFDLPDEIDELPSPSDLLKRLTEGTERAEGTGQAE